MIATDFHWRKDRVDEIFFGWFIPDAISFDRIPYTVLEPIRKLKSLWFDTFRSLSRHADFSTRDVNGRLYRTWEHATMYHVDGLQRIKQLIRG